MLRLLGAIYTRVARDDKSVSAPFDDDKIVLLWPFCLHDMSSVRFAALQTMSLLFDRGNWARLQLRSLLWTLFQSMLFASQEKHAQLAYDVWCRAVQLPNVCDVMLAAGVGVDGTASLFDVLFRLLAHPAGLVPPIDCLLLPPPPKKPQRDETELCSDDDDDGNGADGDDCASSSTAMPALVANSRVNSQTRCARRVRAATALGRALSAHTGANAYLAHMLVHGVESARQAACCVVAAAGGSLDDGGLLTALQAQLSNDSIAQRSRALAAVALARRTTLDSPSESITSALLQAIEQETSLAYTRVAARAVGHLFVRSSNVVLSQQLVSKFAQFVAMPKSTDSLDNNDDNNQSDIIFEGKLEKKKKKEKETDRNSFIFLI